MKPKSVAAQFSAKEKRWLDSFLKLAAPASLNSFPRRYARTVAVLDQYYARHKHEFTCCPGAEYLRFLTVHRKPTIDLIRLAFKEARSLAASANARKGTKKRWKGKTLAYALGA